VREQDVRITFDEFFEVMAMRIKEQRAMFPQNIEFESSKQKC
jgi:hypothetical protein